MASFRKSWHSRAVRLVKPAYLVVVLGFCLALAETRLALPIFEDVTAQARIAFRQQASHTSRKYLPEAMGAGVAMFDYNND